MKTTPRAAELSTFNLALPVVDTSVKHAKILEIRSGATAMTFKEWAND